MTQQQDFETFWKSYPRKVGKLAAAKAYALVRKNGAGADEIIYGLEQYLFSLPSDARFIPHPRTWLAQGRWMDEPDSPKVTPRASDWFEECKRIHNGECGLDRWRHMTRTRVSA